MLLSGFKDGLKQHCTISFFKKASRSIVKGSDIHGLITVVPCKQSRQITSSYWIKVLCNAFHHACISQEIFLSRKPVCKFVENLSLALPLKSPYANVFVKFRQTSYSHQFCTRANLCKCCNLLRCKSVGKCDRMFHAIFAQTRNLLFSVTSKRFRLNCANS